MTISKYAKRYDWDEINSYYHSDKSITFRDCQAKFGFSSKPWTDAVNRGAIIKKDRSIPLEELFCSNCKRAPAVVRENLRKLNLIEYQCQLCNNKGEWNGSILVLQLDHINGINNDNRLQNLRYLCPNCHSQTETYAGKNKANPDRVPKMNYSPVPI